MISRIFGGFIMTFWAVMMIALFRAEYLPKTMPLEPVAAERVLQKIFSNPEPSTLNVSYQGRKIGTCRIDISPVHDEGRAGKLHRLQADLFVQMTFGGAPQRVRFNGDAMVDEQYRVEGFRLRASLGEDQIEISGNGKNPTATLLLTTGGVTERRELNFDQALGGGLASALGLAGLGGFSLPTGSGGESKMATTIVVERLRIGEIVARAYAIQSRLNDLAWAKLWVSELGEILRIETSMGLTMESALFDLAGDERTERTP